MTTIQVRVNEKTKASATRVLHKLGMDMSGAVNAFLQQIVLRKGIPFRLLTENGFTVEEEEEINRIADEAARGINVTKAMSGEEALAYLRSL